MRIVSHRHIKNRPLIVRHFTFVTTNEIDKKGSQVTLGLSITYDSYNSKCTLS